MKKLTANGRTIYAAEYKSMDLAMAAMSHTVKGQALILGDNDAIWMVRMSDAERLAKAGYEYAD